MWRIRCILLIPLLGAGCLSNTGGHQQNTAPVIEVKPSNDPGTATKSDLTASSNQIQNQITGLGANIGQLATKMSAFEGDLLRIRTRLEANINNNLDLKAEMKNNVNLQAALQAKITNQMQAMAELKAELKAQVQATAELRAELQAVGAAQAGIANKFESKIDQLTQHVSSGRDSIVSTTQFNDDMMKTIIWGNALYAGIIVTIIIACMAVVLILSKRSRERAERRYLQQMQERMEKDKMIMELTRQK